MCSMTQGIGIQPAREKTETGLPLQTIIRRNTSEQIPVPKLSAGSLPSRCQTSCPKYRWPCSVLQESVRFSRTVQEVRWRYLSNDRPAKAAQVKWFPRTPPTSTTAFQNQPNSD